jgi:polysaccharide biosynthesis protein PslH
MFGRAAAESAAPPRGVVRSTRRGLLLSRSLPWPPSIGTQQRTNLFHRALSRVADVDTLVIGRHSHPDPASIPVLEREFGFLGRVVPSLPTERQPWAGLSRIMPRTAGRAAFRLAGPAFELAYDRKIARRVRQTLKTGSYDFVVSRYLDPLGASESGWSLPILADVDDFRSDAMEGRARTLGTDVPRAVPAIRQREQYLCAVCAHVFVSKPADLARVGHARASVLPNVPFVPNGMPVLSPCLDDGRSQSVLFVGSFGIGFNIRAVDHFVIAVWPAVVRAVPEARLMLVGAGMSPEMEKNWGSVPGVEVIGYVDALADVYASCAFSVCPVFDGGGSKIKILESLLHARTCVISPHSLRGYEEHLRDGESLCVAADDSAMIEMCIRLLRHPELRQQLADRGRRQVLAYYSVERFEAVVEEGLTRTLGSLPT